jgi:Fe2+ or Zn2+ uptake regulation protein
MILEEETFEKYGYYPRDLKPQSNKRILAACNDCGKVREIENSQYSALCFLCSLKGENHPNWKGGGVNCICIECESIFTVQQSYFDK